MLKGRDVKVLTVDHKRLYQESKKTDEEQQEEEEILENHMEDIVNNRDLNQDRCRKCFITHFPHPKFCRWEAMKRGKRNDDSNTSSLIDMDIVKNINDKICSLESTTKVNEKMPNHHINLCDSFLQKSCNSSNSPDLCFQTFHSDFFPENRFKLKGGSRLKIFDTENRELSRILAIFRSLAIFHQFNEHKKCKIQNRSTSTSLCSFCLARSVVIKSKIAQGRQLIKPVELLCDLPMDIELQTTAENVSSFFQKMNKSLPMFQDCIATKWNCFSCKEDQHITEDFCIDLDDKSNSRSIEKLLTLKSSNLSSKHCCKSKTDENEIKIGNNVRVCLFYSSLGMDVNLESPVRFGGNTWKCSSVITSTRSVFKARDEWYFCEEKNLNNLTNRSLTDVLFATYEKIEVVKLTGGEIEYCYTGDELTKLRNIMP